jgi:hypothetical protein
MGMLDEDEALILHKLQEIREKKAITLEVLIFSVVIRLFPIY